MLVILLPLMLMLLNTMMVERTALLHHRLVGREPGQKDGVGEIIQNE
jgi:hypothetical protein